MYFRLIGVYGIINQYGLKMVGGLLSDKFFHSPTKYLRIGYLITAVVLIAFTWMPYQTFGIWAGIIISLAISACVYSMRAVFFAPMDEVDVPPRNHRLCHVHGLLHRLSARRLHVRRLRLHPR